MKAPRILASILAAALLWGCSSTPTKIDSGAITATSFSFVKPKPKPYPVFGDPDQKVHEWVQKAITDCLAKRNIGKVESGADILVAYMVITGNNASIASIEDYFGYGRSASELRNTAYKKYTSGDGGQFHAGTLLIDLIDGSGRVLHRGYASRALKGSASPEERAARIEEVVEQILSEVQFKK